MKCYFLMGLPGSGKSFLTEKILKEKPDTVVLSMDNIIEDYAKNKNMTYRDVWAGYIKEAEKQFETNLMNAITLKKDIVWDQTNLQQLSRSIKIQRLLDNFYEIDAFALELSDSEWKSRINQREQNGGKTIKPEVLEDMKKSYQSPQYLEGFKNIFFVNDKNEIALKFKQSSSNDFVALIKASREQNMPIVDNTSIKHSN